MDVESFNEHLQGSKSRIRTLEKTKEGLQNEISNVRGQKEESNEVAKANYDAYMNLLTEYNALRWKLEQEEKDHQKDNTQFETRINDLTNTNDRLRHMIVPVSEEQLLDSDVVSKFTSLRASILALVRQTWITSLKSGIDFGELSPYQKELFRSIPISYERLRHVVFCGVYRIILGPKRYFLGNSFQLLEKGIQEVEQKLSERPSGGNNSNQIF
jgi:molecular chaperone GrpE (heat shock protein)